MHKYRFEVKATQVITLLAENEEEARAFLERECGQTETHLLEVPLATTDHEAGLVDDYLAWEDGEPFLAEVDDQDSKEEEEPPFERGTFSDPSDPSDYRVPS